MVYDADVHDVHECACIRFLTCESNILIWTTYGMVFN